MLGQSNSKKVEDQSLTLSRLL